jgi:nitroimidazol reductase NimA-like FMN-containing flavoprotein (pyridoxamine 5'-phosphate oxidase superfamily)
VAHETDEDLRELQRLLDESHAAAGAHLKRIFTDERRVSAADLSARLTGVQVTALATVTAAGEPRVAPVDGLFYRGRIWFGSAPDSNRFRNIRARPQVSATVIDGEEFALVVHGTAREIVLAEPEHEGFREYIGEVYGRAQIEWATGHPYAWIEPKLMFSFGGV